MSRLPDPGKRGRDQRTVYLHPDVWRSIHLDLLEEQRLALTSGDPEAAAPTMIQFLESVIVEGLKVKARRRRRKDDDQGAPLPAGREDQDAAGADAAAGEEATEEAVVQPIARDARRPQAAGPRVRRPSRAARIAALTDPGPPVPLGSATDPNA
jgi:hypothetical protein